MKLGGGKRTVAAAQRSLAASVGVSFLSTMVLSFGEPVLADELGENVNEATCNIFLVT